jgi:hypothetical protein
MVSIRQAPGRQPGAEATRNETKHQSSASVAQELWDHIFGGLRGYISISTAKNPTPGEKPKQNQTLHTIASAYPHTSSNLLEQARQRSEAGCDAWFTVHMLERQPERGKRGTKEYAGKVHTLWGELDGPEIPTGELRPTAVADSSPGHHHCYWRLSRPLDPTEAEALNKRLNYAIGADTSKHSLTTLLRIPGTRNYTRPGYPVVSIVYIEDRSIDPDELDQLLPEAPTTSSNGTAPLTPPDDNEPPVNLTGYALNVWHGQVGPHADRQDRSDHLFAIAKDLYRAGLTSPAWIAAALEERDQSLWDEPKYADRPEQYRVAALKAAQSVESEQPEPTPKQRTEPHQGQPVEDEELAHLRAILERHRHMQSWTMQVIQNKHIKGEKLTALAVIFDVSNALSSDTRERDPANWVRISRKLIADKAGCSENTVTNHIQRLNSWGILERRIVAEKFVYDVHLCEFINEETGEILENTAEDDEETAPKPGETRHINKLYVRLKADPIQTLKTLAFLNPEREETWGGWRVSDKKHPEGAIVVRHVAKSKGTNRHLVTWTTEHKPTKKDEPASIKIPKNATGTIQLSEDAEIEPDGELPEDVPIPTPTPKHKLCTSVENYVDSLRHNERVLDGSEPPEPKTQDCVSLSRRAKQAIEAGELAGDKAAFAAELIEDAQVDDKLGRKSRSELAELLGEQ